MHNLARLQQTLQNTTPDRDVLILSSIHDQWYGRNENGWRNGQPDDECHPNQHLHQPVFTTANARNKAESPLLDAQDGILELDLKNP